MKRFRLSLLRSVAFLVPFIVVGVLIAVAGPGPQRIAGVALAAAAGAILVLAARIRVDCFATHVEVRYLGSPVTYERGTTVEGAVVRGLVGGSRMLTFVSKSGKTRSLSLEFFGRRTRVLIVTEIERSLGMVAGRANVRKG